MLNSDFAKKCINVATNVKTLYVMGGWGEPLTDYWKNYFITHYEFNRSIDPYGKDRAALIRAASADTYAFDCNCSIKSILDGFKADPNQTYGGATYGKPCPDYSINNMLLKECVDVSSNMSNILIGEYIVSTDKGHCGIYVGVIGGKRMVAESTYRWADGYQLTDMDCDARKNMWGYHGKLWNFMDYKYKEKSLFTDTTANASPKLDTNALKAKVNSRVKAQKGDICDYVKDIQKVLIARGYSCGALGADGNFGTGTVNAVKLFQKDNSLSQTGIVDYATVIKLIG